MSAEKEDLSMFETPSQVPTLPNKMEEASSFEHPSETEVDKYPNYIYTPYVPTKEDLKRADRVSRGEEMDEPLTEEEYSEYMTSYFHNHEAIFDIGTRARLYWNLDHYPIPHDIDKLESMFKNIKLALHRLASHGRLEIYAYGDKDPHPKLDETTYTFTFTPRQVGEKSVAGQMSRDILDYAFLDIIIKPHIVVLSDDNPELLRVLKSLCTRLPYVLTITPQPEGPPFYESADSVYACTRYLHRGGRKPPHPRHLYVPDEDEDEDKDEDEGSKTVVLWDEGDCPFLSPNSMNHRELLKKIDSALRDRTFPGEISVMVYLDEGKEYKGLLPPGKRTREGSTVPIEFESERVVDREDSKSKSKIEFHRTANKTARLERMFNDIYLWAIDNDYNHFYQSNVIIVADGVRQDKKFHALKRLSGSGYRVYLVVPPSTKDNGPEQRSDWPGFLFDGALELPRR